MKKLCVNLFLILSFFLSSMPIYAAEWDGYVGENKDEIGELTIVDMNNYGAIVNSGGIPSSEHKKSAKYTTHWKNHQVNSTVSFTDNIPRDWTKYSSIEFSIYSEKATQGVIYFIVRTDQEMSSGASYLWASFNVDWSGWKNFCFTFGGTLGAVRAASYSKINGIEFTSIGWTAVADPESDLYIDSIKLTGGDVSNTLPFLFPVETIENAMNKMEGKCAVYNDSNKMMNGSNVIELEKPVTVKDNITYVPLSVYENYFDEKAQISEDNIVLKEKEISDYYSEDDTVYVPLIKTADIYAKSVVQYRDLTVIGDDIEKDFNMLDIVAYKLTYSYVDTDALKDEDYACVKDKWRARILGDDSVDLNDQYVKTKLTGVESSALSVMGSMNKDSDDKELWGNNKITTTAEMTALYSNIFVMARGYGTKGTKTYKSEELKENIIYALNYMYDHIYGEGVVTGKNLWRSTTEFNWWDWQIGSPTYLVDTLMILEDDLDESSIKKYLAPVDKLVYQPWDYGSNIADEASIIMGSALLQKNGERVFFGKKYIEDIMKMSDYGNGFHRDGSYVFHGNYAMNNAYGMNHYSKLASAMALLEGSAFQINNPMKYNIIDITFNSFIPVLYKGNAMIYVAGREMGRGTSEQQKGLSMMDTFIDVLKLANDEQKKEIEETIKYTALNNPQTDYYTSLSIGKIAEFERIMNDNTISGNKELVENKIFYAMDKAVHQRGDFAFALSMSSSRIANYDSINDENTQGWYTGDGMTYIYNDDILQYDPTYWANVNYYRMPGTTVDTQKREKTSFSTAYVSSKDFVGGASDGKYGTAAMWLESYHNENDEYPVHKSSLQAKKSWFMFDDEVVALGAGITANDDFEVDTVVENRKSGDVNVIRDPSVTLYNPVSVSASDVPQKENSPENTIDGNFGTRWSADGSVWIQYDLGEVKPVGYIGIAFMSGSMRRAKFDIDISEDGISWNKVFSGESSGKTDELEPYNLSSQNARYIRILGNGSSSGTWTSITEVSIFGPYKDGSMKLGSNTYVGKEKVLVDNDNVDLNSNNTVKENVKWVNLENTGGYYFPSGETINMRKTNKSVSFFEMWINHDKNPNNAGYSYVLLPNKTPEQTDTYSKNPDIEVLLNNEQIQAVHEKNIKMTGIVFWEKGSFNGVTVENPLIINLKDIEEGIEVTLSDPTQLLKETEIRFDENFSVDSSDNNIEKLNATSGTKIKVSLNNEKGNTIKFILKKGDENENEKNEENTGGNNDSGNDNAYARQCY